MTTLTPLAATEVANRLKSGRAVLIDIREPDEFAAGHAPGARSLPMSGLKGHIHPAGHGRDVIFTCRTGMRTSSNCDRLAGHVDGQAYVLAGGLDAWKAAGLPVERITRAPMEIIRQVHLVAGLLILTGLILGSQVNPVFYLLSGLVGVGLTFAGASGVCLMAKLLAFAPWNRQVA